MKRLIPLSASALALALVTSCGSGGVTSAIGSDAYKVNTTTVSRSSFNDELKQLSGNASFVALLGSGTTPQLVKGTAANTIDAAFARQELGFDIIFELIHEEVTAKGIKVDPTVNAEALTQVKSRFGGDTIWNAFSAAFQKRSQDQIAELLQLRLSYVGQTQINDTVLKAAYDKDPTVFSTKCYSHILVKTKAEADAIEAQLTAGGDFATIAKAKSTDTTSGANGGDLTSGTCQTKTEIDGAGYVKEFSTAVDAAKLAVPTAPFQSQFGFHIVLITKAAQPTWDTIKTQIKSYILGSSLPQFQAWQKAAYAKAAIKVDPRYGAWDPTTTTVIALPANKADVAVN